MTTGENQSSNSPLDVTFKATIRSDCFAANCTSFSEGVAGEFQEAFTAAIPDGLTAKINSIADDNGVDALKSPVAIQNKTYSFNWFNQDIEVVSGSPRLALCSMAMVVTMGALILV